MQNTIIKLLSYSALLMIGCAKPGGALQDATVDFDITNNNTNAPATVGFVNKSKFANGFIWYFGDGDSSKNVQVSHLYANAGNYVVTLKAFTDKGIKTVSKNVTVFSRLAPAASFTYQMPKPFVLASTATFTNTSVNAVSYVWDFGDGAKSTLSDPTHTYIAAGNFSVILKAFSSSGDSATFTTQLLVKATADSLYIDKVTIVNTPTTWGMGYPFDFGDNPDYYVAIGNWIDTTKLRTYIISNTIAFPLVYNLPSPLKMPVPADSRTPYLNTVSVLDFDDPYNSTEGDRIDMNIRDYIINPNAYPDEITLITTGNKSTIKFQVRWK